MSESMETGGFGKNPAIDKINQLDTVNRRMNAVTELEKKMFQTEQSRAKAVLRRRKQLTEEFHISFRKMEKEENGEILYSRERGQYPG
ncbi:MAG: hypothetical protein J6D08_13295 [Lachnospiraceae bacterium]|nr:hypothetical protein [Lachnospiraceae bacterium]